MSKHQNQSADTLVVGGAGADGHGVVSGWDGSGPMRYAQLAEIAKRTGVSDEHMPTVKNIEAQLARAVRAVAGSAYNVETEKKGDRQVVEEREPAARYFLVEAGVSGAAKAGDKFGDIALVVTLYKTITSHELVFDCTDEQLIADVRREFDQRVGNEMLVAADVTRWLKDVHLHQLNAVRYGIGWYVPRAHRQIAEALCDEFVSAKWGAWMNPPLPVATSRQLAQGIAIGLIAEVAGVMEDLMLTREKLREKKGATADIGPSTAETYMIRFSRVGARVVSFQHALGDERLAECQNAIHDAMIALDNVLEGGITSDWNGIWKGIEAMGRRIS